MRSCFPAIALTRRFTRAWATGTSLRAWRKLGATGRQRRKAKLAAASHSVLSGTDDARLTNDELRRKYETAVETPSSPRLGASPGGLKSRKGINVPELQIDCSALTAKDREDAAYLCGMGVDYIALSFAQKAADLQELIDLMDAQGVPPEARPAIIPKIEKPAALKNIDEILELSGGMMVARGDLGVELGLHRVPYAQKFLIRKANAAGKFCITATQMMESMIENAVPTRAEVSDVANAIFDGTDAVMLSGESAMGVDPANVVQWMGKVISEAEAHSDDVAPSF